MHDIDRTLTEFDPEMEGLDSGEYEFEESEHGDSESESVFDETEEMELAAELLSVSNEAELDQFLGDLVKRAGRVIGKVIKSPLGRALVGLLKGVARKALPIVGGAIGSAFGGPAGGAIGGQLAPMAGRLFGLELEGLSPEDQEYEVARRFVRFGGAATGNAAAAADSIDAATAAKQGVVAAANQHAPGLLRPAATGAMPGVGGGRSGRWVRRGRKIVVLGV